MTKTITCILCPRGCTLTVTVEGAEVSVAGNSCPRGAKYGADECTHPTRIITAVVRVENREQRMLSVKTEAPVPKEHTRDVMAKLDGLTVEAPIRIGDPILEDIFGTRIIATSEVQ